MARVRAAGNGSPGRLQALSPEDHLKFKGQCILTMRVGDVIEITRDAGGWCVVLYIEPSLPFFYGNPYGVCSILNGSRDSYRNVGNCYLTWFLDCGRWTGAIGGTAQQGHFPSNYVSKEEALYTAFQVMDAAGHLWWGWDGGRVPPHCRSGGACYSDPCGRRPRGPRGADGLAGASGGGASAWAEAGAGCGADHRAERAVRVPGPELDFHRMLALESQLPETAVLSHRLATGCSR